MPSPRRSPVKVASNATIFVCIESDGVIVIFSAGQHKGANGLGRGIAQVLVTADKDVVDVPSTLAMKVRVLSTGGGRKTDPDDAYAVARAAPQDTRDRKDQTTILRLLSERRPPVEPRSDCPPTQRLFVIQSALAALWSAPLWSSQRSR